MHDYTPIHPMEGTNAEGLGHNAPRIVRAWSAPINKQEAVPRAASSTKGAPSRLWMPYPNETSTVQAAPPAPPALQMTIGRPLFDSRIWLTRPTMANSTITVDSTPGTVTLTTKAPARRQVNPNSSKAPKASTDDAENVACSQQKKIRGNVAINHPLLRMVLGNAAAAWAL